MLQNLSHNILNITLRSNFRNGENEIGGESGDADISQEAALASGKSAEQ